MKKKIIFIFISFFTLPSFAQTNFTESYSTLQKLFKNENKNEIAALFKYPMKVAINNISTTFQTEKDLIKQFEEVFTNKVKYQIMHTSASAYINKKGEIHHPSGVICFNSSKSNKLIISQIKK